MDNSGYIKLHRSMLSWEWYSDNNVKSVFLHLLLTANYEPKRWQGRVIERGELITSRGHLAAECGLSVQQTRTALKKLQSTGEIVIKSTSQFTLITICNYANYQDRTNDEQPTNNQQSTSNQPANNQQITTTKEYKEIKNNIECVYTREENFSFSEKLLLDQTWIEQMAMQLHNPTGDAGKNIELIARLIQEANLAFQADGDYPHDYSSFRQRCRMYIIRHYKRMLNDLKMSNNNLKSNNYGNTQSCARQIGSDNPDDYRVEWAKY